MVRCVCQSAGAGVSQGPAHSRLRRRASTGGCGGPGISEGQGQSCPGRKGVPEAFVLFKVHLASSSGNRVLNCLMQKKETCHLMSQQAEREGRLWTDVFGNLVSSHSSLSPLTSSPPLGWSQAGCRGPVHRVLTW